jgi:hypothetical protein
MKPRTPKRDRWNAALNELVASGKTRRQAVVELSRANPKLHAEYIEESNNLTADQRKQLT